MAKQSAAMASVPGAMLTRHSLIVTGKHAMPEQTLPAASDGMDQQS